MFFGPHDGKHVEYSFEARKWFFRGAPWKSSDAAIWSALIVYITGAAEGLYAIELRCTLKAYSDSGP